jgi:hypothetical protein
MYRIIFNEVEKEVRMMRIIMVRQNLEDLIRINRQTYALEKC